MFWLQLVDKIVALRKRRFLKEFKSVGQDCVFLGDRMELGGKMHLGDGVELGNNLVLHTNRQGVIRIGSRTVVSDYVMMHSNDRVEVGEDCYIGPYCVLRDNNHVFQGTDAHWRYTPPIIKPIILGPKCFLGARSYVMPGVTLGEGAVILPGSLVTRNVGAYEIWGGSPSAQFIGDRKDPERTCQSLRHRELLNAFTGDAATTATTED